MIGRQRIKFTEKTLIDQLPSPSHDIISGKNFSQACFHTQKKKKRTTLKGVLEIPNQPRWEGDNIFIFKELITGSDREPPLKILKIKNKKNPLLTRGIESQT